MKKLIKISMVSMSLMVGSFGLSYINGINDSKVYAQSAVTETTTTSTTTETEVDLSAKARVYTADELNAEYKSSSTIKLADNATKASDSSVSVDGNTITITEPGTYVLSGTLTNGQVIVDVADKEKVQLVLDGVSITNKTSSPIFIKKAKDYAMITLAEGSRNTLTDGEIYDEPVSEEDEELDSTIYSKADLILNGTGTLNVNANYNDAIKSKDTLYIASGNYVVNSVNDAFYGKDSITIEDGTFTVKTYEGAESAEMKVEQMGGGHMGQMPEGMIPPDFANGQMPEGMMPPDFANGQMPEGMIPPDFANGQMLEGMMPPDFKNGQMGKGQRGQMNATVATDATASVSVNNKAETTETEVVAEDTESNKGFKSKGEIVINNGLFNIDTYDDGFNSSTFLEINGGVFNIKAGNDAIKADYILTINGGTININYCYEGIESEKLNFNGGDIKILSEDDGINASSASGTSTMFNPMGADVELSVDDPVIYFNGSNVTVKGKGDSIDSNGGIIINDGILMVQGVNNGGELAVDFDKQFKINGGNLLVIGGVGSVSTSSTQNIISTDLTITNGETVKITNVSGKVLFETTAQIASSAITFSSSDVIKGETYTVTSGANKATVTADTASTVTNKATSGVMGRGMGNKNQQTITQPKTN